jgi:hypothetical protein
MPLRNLSDAEFEQVCYAIETVRQSLSADEENTLRLMLADLNESVRAFWRILAKTPIQRAKELRTVAGLSRELANALGEPPDGDWREAEQSPIVELSRHMNIIYSESGPPAIYPGGVYEALRLFDRLLDDVALAAERAANDQSRLAKGSGDGLRRGRDKAATTLLFILRGIWVSFTDRQPDAWIDAGTGEYRGDFWRFVWASSVVCREFMGSKGTAGSLFSRLERLIRKQNQARGTTIRQSK